MVRRLLDSPWFYFGVAVLLVGGALFSMLEVRPADRPVGTLQDLATLQNRKDLNVVFVLIDTLRADRLSSYGYHRQTSPMLDRIAESGIRFAHVTAQSSWTKSSMTSIWTSTYPVSHGVLRSQHGIPDEATVPAEIFRKAGFETAGIWRNGWVSQNFGFGQGFDFYDRPIPNASPERLRQRTASSMKLPGSDEDIYDAAKEYIAGAKGKRFFLYLHYMDVHQYVYDDSADFGPTFSDVYDNAIHWVDRNVEALLATLQEHGLLDKTLVVVAADHGEGFKEHGLEGHARSVYTEVIDVPLFIMLPFRLPKGIVVEERVENIDIFPTVLDLMGLPPIPGAQGVSLVPAIQAAAAAPARSPTGTLTNWGGRTSFSHLDRTWGTPDAEPSPFVAVTDGPWRYIHVARHPERSQLYDHRTDPAEQKDVLAEQPEIAASLRAKLDEYFALPKAAWGRPTEVQIDRLRLEQLRALGYEVGEGEAIQPGAERSLKDLKNKTPDASPPAPPQS